MLAEIKNDEELKHIPIVIMTISQAEEDILKSYNLHANCYITKPIDLNQFIKVVKSIEDFWFSIVKLPPKTNTRIIHGHETVIISEEKEQFTIN